MKQIALLSVSFFLLFGSPLQANDLPQTITVLDVTGISHGRWTSSNGINSGQITLDLTQDGSSVKGTASIQGSDCFKFDLQVLANISSNNFMTGSILSKDFDISKGSIQLRVAVSYEPKNAANGLPSIFMLGTYSVHNGQCHGDTGTWGSRLDLLPSLSR